MEVSDTKKNEENKLSIKMFKSKYPVSVIILLIIKWLDSFSFSGTYGLVTLYFISQLFNLFTYEFYLHQMFGTYMIILALITATITDSWLGKFNAFIGSNIALLLGHFTVIIKELLPENLMRSRFLITLGLFFMASATDNKIPCILCLAGDQFTVHQVKQRNKVFSLLYLSTVFGTIFANSFLFFIIEKICFPKNCYLLTIGCSTGVVVFNLVAIIFSKKFFFIEAPQGSRLLKILKCVQSAIKNQLCHCSWKTPRRDHWLDWASDKFSENHISEVKRFFRMLLFLLPFPIFWALVEKQNVEWALQAKKMENTVAGQDLEKEDFRLFFSTALLIILLGTELVFLPLAEYFGINIPLIKKIALGMIIIYLSSLMSFLLELQVENSPSIMPGLRKSFVRIFNTADVSFQVMLLKNKTSVVYSGVSQVFQSVDHYEIIYLDSEQQQFYINLYSNTFFKEEAIVLEERTKYIVVVSGIQHLYSIMLVEETTAKPENGFANVRVINNLKKDVYVIMPMNTYNLTKYNRISPDLNIRIRGNRNLLCMIGGKEYVLELGVLQFGVSYLIFIIEDIPVLTIWKTQGLEIKSLSVAWQLPQFLIMGIGKYLLTVSCIQLFYYEAPRGMGVTMQALWNSTPFHSSLILYFLTYTSFLPKWIELFLLSIFLLALIVTFFIIGYFYQETVPREPFS